MEGEAFQKITRAINPSAWLIGENKRKKTPGSTTLKYCLAAAMELGISLPHDLASTKEVNRLVNSKPLARLIDANKIIFFMIFFYKDGFNAGGGKLYLTDILIDMTLSHSPCFFCSLPVSCSCNVLNDLIKCD